MGLPPPPAGDPGPAAGGPLLPPLTFGDVTGSDGEPPGGGVPTPPPADDHTMDRLLQVRPHDAEEPADRWLTIHV